MLGYRHLQDSLKHIVDFCIANSDLLLTKLIQKCNRTELPDDYELGVFDLVQASPGEEFLVLLFAHHVLLNHAIDSLVLYINKRAIILRQQT